MAAVVFKGFYTALQAGSLAGTPDIRHKLTMGDTTCDTEEDSVYLSDFTDIDEFDGIGYAELDAASVTFAYVDADDEMQLDFTSPASSETLSLRVRMTSAGCSRISTWTATLTTTSRSAGPTRAASASTLRTAPST